MYHYLKEIPGGNPDCGAVQSRSVALRTRRASCPAKPFKQNL